MSHCYHDLPATLRGNALEAHDGWPRTWTAPDHDTALRVLQALTETFEAGGVNHLYAKWITATDDACVVHVDRVA